MCGAARRPKCQRQSPNRPSPSARASMIQAPPLLRLRLALAPLARYHREVWCAFTAQHKLRDVLTGPELKQAYQQAKTLEHDTCFQKLAHKAATFTSHLIGKKMMVVVAVVATVTVTVAKEGMLTVHPKW